MKTNTKNIPLIKRFPIYLFTVLMVIALLLGHQASVFAAQVVKIGGNADVIVSSCSVSHGANTKATINQDGEDKVIMQAELSMPGEWACFEFTVENCGSVEAVLSDVLKTDTTPDNLLISFGISEKDSGETLKPHEQCTVSIVAQLDPEETDSLSATGDFVLTLVYDAIDISNDNNLESGTGEDISPQTGEASHLMLAVGCLLLSILVVLFTSRKQRRV